MNEGFEPDVRLGDAPPPPSSPPHKFIDGAGATVHGEVTCVGHGCLSVPLLFAFLCFVGYCCRRRSRRRLDMVPMLGVRMVDQPTPVVQAIPMGQSMATLAAVDEAVPMGMPVEAEPEPERMMATKGASSSEYPSVP